MEEQTLTRKTGILASLFRREIALPQEHGAWVFFLSPFIIGWGVSGRSINGALVALFLASLGGFLARHPLTIIIKARSGRRALRESRIASVWLLVYGCLSLLGTAKLISLGYAFILWIALPVLALLGIYLWLVSLRSERHNLALDIATAATMALIAPAAYWTSIGNYHPIGWMLWGLCTLHATGAILHAFMRLEQRRWKTRPEWSTELRVALPSLLFNAISTSVVLLLSLTGNLPGMLPIAFALQWFETLYGAVKPAIRVRPTAIGLRQLAISSLFTLLVILFWR